MQTDPFYAKDIEPHGSWVGAVDMGEEIILLGSLGLDAHVTLNGNSLEGRYESEGGEWLIARGGEAVVFSVYSEELEKRFGEKTNKATPRVWCSWYSLYTAIDENILCKAFDDLRDLPFDVLQVDDGWQTAVGDWEANKNFPSGMAFMAEKIKSTDRIAGLWLAPFIAVKSSKLFRKHPEWFLHDRRGKPVSAGFNWGEQLYAPDTTHPEVLDWLAALMRQIRAWGFDYVKLDFLYGGALPGVRHEDMPREAAFRNGLKILREALGADAYLLACGAPILPSLGLCDALRVGPDVAGQWENHRDAVLLYNPAIPGTKNAVRTTLHRLWLNSLVQVDPDVAYFRSAHCGLTTEQKSLLQNLALICGFKATSDLPQWLMPAEQECLHKFLEDKPEVKQTSPYTFQFDGHLVDFNPAVSLPAIPRGVQRIQAVIVGWLGNQGWILKLLNKIHNGTMKELKKDLTG